MTRPDIFAATEPPADHRGLAIGRHAKWYTWSAAFRNVIAAAEAWLRTLPEPRLVHVPGLATEYDYTLAVAASPPPPVQRFARSLCTVRRPRGIMLFTGLLDQPLDGFLLRRLFALLRGSIAGVLGNERFSLYAPLGAIGRHAGDFALHADLYPPELLFNVFEEVPADASGASIFLPTRELHRLIEHVAGLPSDTRDRVAACFRHAADEDRFNELFSLLHDTSRPGVRALESAMRDRQLRVKLATGQGYLIHDRTWLHGREAPTGGVSRRRVHRLVFNTVAIQRSITGKRAAAPR